MASHQFIYGNPSVEHSFLDFTKHVTSEVRRNIYCSENSSDQIEPTLFERTASLYSYNTNQLFHSNVILAPFDANKELPSLPNPEYSRPPWKYTQLVAFALLNKPNATATVVDMVKFIIDTFPFFETMVHYSSLYSGFGRSLRREKHLFKRTENTGTVIHWTVVDRLRFFGEIEKRECNDVKLTMKQPELLDCLLSKVEETNDIATSILKFIEDSNHTGDTTSSFATATAMVTAGEAIDIFNLRVEPTLWDLNRMPDTYMNLLDNTMDLLDSLRPSCLI